MSVKFWLGLSEGGELGQKFRWSITTKFYVGPNIFLTTSNEKKTSTLGSRYHRYNVTAQKEVKW